MAYNVKSIRKKFKDQGIFYTDDALAQKMKSYLPEDTEEAYDPTCGDGQLLAAFGDEVRKYGQEINGPQLEEARARLKNFTGICGDTLKEPGFMDRKFKAICANPPFSLKWEPPEDKDSDPRFAPLPCIPTKGKADYAFLAHILYMLSDDGTAVVLNAPGILFRGQREGKIREWLVEQNYIDTVEHIEGGHFEDTDIATCLLVLKKNRETTDVRFISPDGERTVSLEEVRKNGYNLSVSRYIEPPRKEEPPVDIPKANNDLRELTLNSLKSMIDIEMVLMQLYGIESGGIGLLGFLDGVEKTVREARTRITEMKEAKGDR